VSQRITANQYKTERVNPMSKPNRGCSMRHREVGNAGIARHFPTEGLPNPMSKVVIYKYSADHSADFSDQVV